MKIYREQLLYELKSIAPALRDANIVLIDSRSKPSKRSKFVECGRIAFDGGLAWASNEDFSVCCKTALDLSGAVPGRHFIKSLSDLIHYELDVELIPYKRPTEAMEELFDFQEVKGLLKIIDQQVDEPVLLRCDPDANSYIYRHKQPKHWYKLKEGAKQAMFAILKCDLHRSTHVHLHPDFVGKTNDIQWAQYNVKTGFQKHILIKEAHLRIVLKADPIEYGITDNRLCFRNTEGTIWNFGYGNPETEDFDYQQHLDIEGELILWDDEEEEQEVLQPTNVRSHFLDSGAYSLKPLAEKYAKETGSQWGFYDTPEFWDYMNAHADFIKKYSIAIDYYANLDVIGNPELTWRNQKYLENTHGLKPVPVIHCGSDLKWVEKYIKDGHDYIGLGGLATSTNQNECRRWLDRVFKKVICNNPEKTPCVKVHGFGIGSYELITGYPWSSVDTTNWFRTGMYGKILVPQKTNGEFDFSKPPHKIKVTDWENLPEWQQDLAREWCEYCDVPVGDMKKEEVGNTQGVKDHYSHRTKANLKYYHLLSESIER